MEQKITEKEVEEMYKEMLEETKEEWIKNYYGADILKEIDPIAYNVGLRDYEDHLEEEGYKIEDVK